MNRRLIPPAPKIVRSSLKLELEMDDGRTLEIETQKVFDEFTYSWEGHHAEPDWFNLTGKTPPELVGMELEFKIIWRGPTDKDEPYYILKRTDPQNPTLFES